MALNLFVRRSPLTVHNAGVDITVSPADERSQLRRLNARSEVVQVLTGNAKLSIGFSELLNTLYL
ncbi:hypothetical protein QUB05_11135 [Microcoleus sp. F10-C6]|uniref:hypothetical protein n=1 Tax=unclassified Microcoleus TaxID=2642155 RepID=UPI002FD59B1C